MAQGHQEGGGTMTDEELYEWVRDTVNASGSLVDEDGDAITAKLDKLDRDAPAASVQQLGGSRFIRRYINGGGISELPFAVTLRTKGTDTAGRISAFSALMGLAAYLGGLERDDLESGINAVRGEDTPTLIERGEDGSEVWRATYVVESTRTGN